MRKNVGYLLAAAGVLVGTAIASARPTSIRTGANTATPGYLEVQPDEYGSWAADFATGGFGANSDRFLPNGSSLQVACFTSGFFFFSGGTQRELLSDNTDWQATYPADASLSRSVTAPNAAFDTNGDGVNDLLTSAFTVSGSGTNLGFQLAQRVISVGGGASAIVQQYRITNNASTPLAATLLRSTDGDLLWNGDFTNDNVGTTMNGAGLGTYVYENEVGSPSQAVTLSGNLANVYYGGKHGVDPDSGGPGPAYNFGTDLQGWNAFGVPVGWSNNIAGVGTGINGDSGAIPPGATAPQDGFIGLSFALNLGAGQSTMIEVIHTYGRTTPIPAPAGVAVLGFGALLLRRRR